MKITSREPQADIKIADVQQMNLKPGDVLLVKVNTKDLSPDQEATALRNIAKSLEGSFPYNEVLVVPLDMEFKTI